MTILYADGFEDATLSDYGTTAFFTVSATGGVGGGACVKSSSYVGYIAFGLPSSTTVFFSVFINLDEISGYGSLLEFFGSGDIYTSALVATSDGKLNFYSGSNNSPVGSSSAGALPTNGYFSLQGKIVFHGSTGSVEVRKNGSSTPILNLTNIDTLPGSATSCVRLRLGGEHNGSNTVNARPVKYDHLVIWDNQGSVNNDWLGELRVDHYFPTADGDSSGWTTSAGSTHWSLVDEAVASAGDYVTTSTLNAQDLYQISNMAHTPTSIQAVVLAAQAKKSDAGTREIALSIKSDTTTVQSANIALGLSSVKYTRIIEKDPDGDVAWTKAAVDAMQIGVKLTV